MTRRLRDDEDGFSLLELLIVMAMLVPLVLGVGAVYDAFLDSQDGTTRKTGAQETVRQETRRVVSTVREGTAVTRATALDLVVQRVTATNTRYDRWCVDPANRLRRESSTSSADPGTACPSTTGWTTAVVAEEVQNTLADPLFRVDANTRAVGVNLSVDAKQSDDNETANVGLGTSASVRANRETRPPVPTGGPGVDCNATSPGGLLTLGLTAAQMSGLNVVYQDEDGVQIGSGSSAVIPAGVSRITAIITNAAGLQSRLLKDVSCG